MNKRQIQSIRGEIGQADGVSTRHLVGNMLTLLDLREKFLTKYTSKWKGVSPPKAPLTNLGQKVARASIKDQLL